ncbi:hypothetical protein [Arthrobacter sp. TWP1-1]|uniref:hypothetical protein n=1 Tax=Arthrobacter sp. TWP1-1 TaxID=2804568 RepID=UPI003CEF6980
MSVISAAIGAYLAVTLATSNLAAWGQWLRDFAQSPGAAAFAALIAAVIAFNGISRQVSVSRESLAHQMQASTADAWWTMFEWASERAIPSRPGDQPLPTSVIVRTLQRLADDATSEVQEAACAGVIDVLTKNIDSAMSEPHQGDADGASSERDESAIAALASYVDSSRGTPAASAIAEALVYKNNVIKSLISLAWDDPTIKVFPKPSLASDAGFDAIAEVNGHRVVIEIKAHRGAERLSKTASQTISRLRVEGAEADGYLLITPFPSPLAPGQESELRAVATQWSKPEDTASLLEALRRASPL